MVKSRDIAVIGMSGIFPEADNIYEFYQNIKNGKDSVREVPTKRLELSGQSLEKEYVVFGYLNEISEFDYSFFNMSYKEAISMDPQQRLALQESCKAIWDSGYSLQDFRGTRTAVIIGCGESGYHNLLSEHDGITTIGNLKAVAAGRIAYHLDLKGPVYVLDTSCSSSLLAVHQACTHLLLGEADYALAGGVALNVLAPEQDELNKDVLGIASTSGRAKTFDEDADGCSGGEGCGFILLKRYEDAVSDKDNIYAVIKGSSINHDAARSNSIAAPSPIAQTEVIIDAWEKAGVDPITITYLEAHGTGTKIGDPIEIKGLTDAFKKYTDKIGFCAISAVKTNIGHTGYNAGISSMLKCILAVYYKVKFPLINFIIPNKMIDFNKSAIYPCTRLTDWDDDIRRAGISSFGLSGTNVHIILEQSPEFEELEQNTNIYYPFLISAKSKAAMKDYCKSLYDWLERSNDSLNNIAFTQCAGRDIFEYKKMFIISSIEELKNELLKEYDYVKSNNNRPCVFLCSNDINISNEDLTKLKFISGDIAKIIENLLISQSNGKTREVIAQIALLTLWKSFGIEPKAIIGCGYGNITVAYALGKLSLDDAIKEAKNYSDEGYVFNRVGFVEAMKETAINDNIYIELGDRGILTDVLAENFADKKGNIFKALEPDKSIYEVFIYLVEQGVKIDWTIFFKNKNARRISIPPYPFEKNKCWIKNIDKNKDTKKVLQKKEDDFDYDQTDDTKAFLRRLWLNVLEATDIGDDDDFFDIGGNSLMGMKIINRIKEFKNVTIEFDDLYDYSTINTLSNYIDGLKVELSDELEEATFKDKEVLSYIQESMLFIYEQNQNSTAYNMPAIIKLTGNLNVQALFDAMNCIINKHDILRTIYKKEDGNYRPVVLEKAEVPYKLKDITKDENAQSVIDNLSKNLSTVTFDLSNEIPIKMEVLKISEREHMLSIQIHHIAADGWSIGIILSELAYYYKSILINGKVIPEKLKMNFSHYAVKNRKFILSDLGQRKIEFWKKHLSDIPDYLKFPTDKKRPEILENNGSILKFEFDVNQAKDIEEFCKEQGVTLYVFMFTVYSILLYRYSNQSNFCIGTPVANRSDVNEEKIIGFFANTLAIHIKIDNTLSFKSYMQNNKELLSKALSNQEVPFDLIVKNLNVNRSTAYSPVFQHGFVLQNMGSEFKLMDVETQFLKTETTNSKFEFMMVITKSQENLTGAIEYTTDLFYEESMISLIEHYKILIDNVISNHSYNIDKIPMLTKKEKIHITENTKAYNKEDYDF